MMKTYWIPLHEAKVRDENTNRSIFVLITFQKNLNSNRSFTEVFSFNFFVFSQDEKEEEEKKNPV